MIKAGTVERKDLRPWEKKKSGLIGDKETWYEQQERFFGHVPAGHVVIRDPLCRRCLKTVSYEHRFSRNGRSLWERMETECTEYWEAVFAEADALAARGMR